MTTARIPAAQLFAVLEAIKMAKLATFDNYAVWAQLNNAQAIVKVYLIDSMEPIDVEITQ